MSCVDNLMQSRNMSVRNPRSASARPDRDAARARAVMEYKQYAMEPDTS